MPFASSERAEIYYECHGAGPAVVFAHGRGGNAASWWQQVPRFAREYRVVVFDHRGFGRSRCAPGAFARSRFADDLLAVLDAESIGRAAIVCQSMGGWTGLATAVRHPERVSCLVLSNTPAGIDLPQVAAALERSRKRFAEHGVGRAAVAADFPARHPEMAYLYAHIGGLNVNLPADLMAGGGSIGVDSLASLDLPTLFITSDGDELFPPQLIRELAARVPGAEVVQLPGAGHSPYFETPEAFNETVARFLARHARGASATRAAPVA